MSTAALNQHRQIMAADSDNLSGNDNGEASDNHSEDSKILDVELNQSDPAALVKAAPRRILQGAEVDLAKPN